MKIILTGVTGNLGYETALSLIDRKIGIIPIIRDTGKMPQTLKDIKFDYLIENDLESSSDIEVYERADLILHCAGNVHLKRAKGINEKMIIKLIKLAKKQRIPLYFVSTAFVYRPKGTKIVFNNNYETDKYISEQTLIDSGIEHSILRPSVLVGNSKTGAIQNFTGYYSIVMKLLQYIDCSQQKNNKMRIPRFTGHSDIIPVDQVARYIADVVQEKKFGNFYLTNPQPPKASWVFNETINFFNVNDSIQVINCTYEEFSELRLTEEEKSFYDFCSFFKPYWSTELKFPNSICEKNLISHDYIKKALAYFARSNYSS